MATVSVEVTLPRTNVIFEFTNHITGGKEHGYIWPKLVVEVEVPDGLLAEAMRSAVIDAVTAKISDNLSLLIQKGL